MGCASGAVSDTSTSGQEAKLVAAAWPGSSITADPWWALMRAVLCVCAGGERVTQWTANWRVHLCAGVVGQTNMNANVYLFNCKFIRSIDQSVDLASTTTKCRHYQCETHTVNISLFFWHRPRFWLVEGVIISALAWSLEADSKCGPWGWLADKNCYLVLSPKLQTAENRFSSSSSEVFMSMYGLSTLVAGQKASTRCRCWHDAMKVSFNSKKLIIRSLLYCTNCQPIIVSINCWKNTCNMCGMFAILSYRGLVQDGSRIKVFNQINKKVINLIPLMISLAFSLLSVVFMCDFAAGEWICINVYSVYCVQSRLHSAQNVSKCVNSGTAWED